MNRMNDSMEAASTLQNHILSVIIFPRKHILITPWGPLLKKRGLFKFVECTRVTIVATTDVTEYSNSFKVKT